MFLRDTLVRPRAAVPKRWAAQARWLSFRATISKRKLSRKRAWLCGASWLTSGIAAALNNLGDVARQRGDYALARSRYEESVTLAREARDAWRVASSLHQLADVARLLGDVESARQQFEECLELWRDLRDPQGLTAALTSLGELASFDGDAAAARDFLDQALELARGLGNTWGTAWVLNTQAAVMRRQGEHAQAHARLVESLALRQELGDRQGLVEGLGASAVLAAASQQTQRAAQLLGAAESVAEDVGVSLAPVYRAEYEAAVGVARRALGEEAFAASFHLGRAMSVERAVSYAMQTEYSPRAKEVLNARVISSSHHPGETLNMSFATLSRRERQVAARIARGFTNRQIASALVISERTAETYVTRILRKLGIDSRVQLAVWAAHSGFQSE